MDIIFTFDKQDYDPSWPRTVRESAKAIILDSANVVMMHSAVYGFYIFPGGAVEEGESVADALIREVAEETGLDVIPWSLRAYGTAVEIRKDIFVDGIFEERQHYFICEAVQAEGHAPNLNASEMLSGYKALTVSLDTAIAANMKDMQAGRTWTKRATFVLNRLKDNPITGAPL